MILSRSVAVLGVALSATLAAGVATAARSGSGSVKACEDSHHNLVLKSHKGCPNGTHSLSLNLRGPRGKAGVVKHGYALYETPMSLSAGSNVVTSIFPKVPKGNYVVTLSVTPGLLGSAPAGTYDVDCTVLPVKAGHIEPYLGRGMSRFFPDGYGPGGFTIPFGYSTANGKLSLTCNSGGPLDLEANITMIPVQSVN